jgi:hypothetical protein
MKAPGSLRALKLKKAADGKQPSAAFLFKMKTGNTRDRAGGKGSPRSPDL